MIPTADVEPIIPSPLPASEMPKSEDISEEGFGGFRGTWFLGRVPIAEASGLVRREAEIVDWLDRTAHTSNEFELLANVIESSEVGDLSDPTITRACATGLSAFLGEPDEVSPLDGLEVGVSGLVHALSAVGCLTAASCRSHASELSWADCPVVFFAAPAWRLAILADMIKDARCGLDAGRGMFNIYGRSGRDLNELAALIVRERRRFRRKPETRPNAARRRGGPRKYQYQLGLGIDADRC